MAEQRLAELRAARDVPAPDRPLVAGMTTRRRELFAVGRKREALHPVGVTAQHVAALRAVGHVPQPNVAVVARSGDDAAVG